MKRTFFISIVIFMCLLSGCGTLTAEPPTSTIPPTEAPAEPTYSNLAYMGDDDPMHTLDIYLPADAAGALPTLLMIHGAPGTKEDLIDIGDYFADQGFAVVMPEYEYGFDTRVTLQNVYCSLAWVHANADQYSFDAQNISLFGYSFGSYLSASVGSFKNANQYQEGCPHPIPDTNQLKGVITYAGMFITQEVCMAPDGGWCVAGAASANKMPLMEMVDIFAALREVPSANWKDSSDLSEEAKEFAQTLPLYWLDGSEPPFLIIHGDADDAVSIVESEAFVKAVQAAGGEAEFLSLPGAGHFSLSLASPSFEKIAEAVETFVKTQ